MSTDNCGTEVKGWKVYKLNGLYAFTVLLACELLSLLADILQRASKLVGPELNEMKKTW